MSFEGNKIYCLLIVLLYVSKYTEGSCELTNLPKSEDVCVASLKCDRVVNTDLSSWDCIVRYKNDYDYNYDYGYRRQVQIRKKVLSTIYKLNVSVQDVDDGNDIFDSVNINKIKNFKINSGNMLSLPHKIYELYGATEIEISNNQLSTVDLNRFVTLTQLTTINLRNNLISTIDVETQADVMPTRSIKSIDLSHNLLESIPNACFSRFVDLHHLNLSHNLIRSFDILTFEGVMELRMIDVSHNALLEIGNSIGRFIKLESLYLQNNKLTNIADYNLNNVLSLEKLNLSSNIINRFENNSFRGLLKLEYLDLSNNTIEQIPKILFETNNNLHSLSVSNNRINYVENGAFDGKNITHFNIQDNNITGHIEQDTFKGVHVSELDLSKGRITSLGNKTFKYMCNDLVSLNISFNKIQSIEKLAFSCLDMIKNLDLSHNDFENLNFAMNLSNLSTLNVSYNGITKITNNTFKNLFSLTNIDLSYNKIQEIESKSFLELKNVNLLTLAFNSFVNVLEKNTFHGMNALEIINLSFTRTTSYQNESFSGLPALKHINSSFGQLSNIDYNTFIETGSILKLDLSHNLLDKFCINTSSISEIEEIYLHHNTIRHITNNTFSELKFLRILYLVDNNILKLEANALKNTENLSHLYLSSNAQMEIIGNPFNNLINLYQVSMDGIKTGFSFQNAANVKIENLDLHSCGIRDLNKLFVFKIGNLRELDLSDNEILTIDKFSFQNMPISTLDLSSNRINFIQPGSFLHLTELRKLSLSGNNLQTLQFGVFDGIKGLTYLNLSSNALQNFEVKLLPVTSTIALDNNDISILKFEDFFESHVNKLSIGRNPIACKVLVELKTSNYSEKFKEIVTTAFQDFHSENVDGISCQSGSQNNGVVLPLANNSYYDIRPVFTQFTNAVNNLRSAIDILGKNTAHEKADSSKLDLTKIVDFIQALVKISNQTRIQSKDYFERIDNNDTTTQILMDIRDQLVNFTSKEHDFNMCHSVDDNKITVNNNDIRSEMKIMLENKIDAIRDEFEKNYQNIQKREPMKFIQENEKESKNDTILYFIAVTLGVIMIIHVINFAFRFLKKDRLGGLSNGRIPIASDIEME